MMPKGAISAPSRSHTLNLKWPPRGSHTYSPFSLTGSHKTTPFIFCVCNLGVLLDQGISKICIFFWVCMTVNIYKDFLKACFAWCRNSFEPLYHTVRHYKSLSWLHSCSLLNITFTGPEDPWRKSILPPYINCIEYLKKNSKNLNVRFVHYTTHAFLVMFFFFGGGGWGQTGKISNLLSCEHDNDRDRQCESCKSTQI